MPKFDCLQTGFSSGELTPLLYGAPDNPRYKKGLQTALNYIPTLQGAKIRRPATKFCQPAKYLTPSTAPVLIPFQFSATQAYILEVGNGYMRFYTDNGQVVTSGTSYKVQVVYQPFTTIGTNGYGTRPNLNPYANETLLSSSMVSGGSVLELQTPYTQADLPYLRFFQNNDAIYILNSNPNFVQSSLATATSSGTETSPQGPSSFVWKLERFGSTYWTIRQVFFDDGPYLPLNSYFQEGDSLNTSLVPATQSIIETQVASYVAGSNVVAGAVTDPAGSGQIQITTSAAHGFSNGQNVALHGVTGTVEANNYYNGAGQGPWAWSIIVTGPTTFLLLGSAFVNVYSSGGTVYPALFFPNDLYRNIALLIAGQRYASMMIPNNAWSAEVLLPYGQTLTYPSTGTAATAWQLGAYSQSIGQPAAGCFHQNRMFLGGGQNNPEEVDGSSTGSFENFAPSDPTTLSVADDNALQFTLASNDANAIRWFASNAQGLCAATYVAEWVISPSSTSEALTPTNFSAQQSSYYGGAALAPISAGNAILYIQRAQRKLREMNYFFQVGTFRSSDLTELSEHITLPSIEQIVYQKETQPLVWAVRSDGNFLSMVYNRDDASLSAGWMRHQLGGQSDAAGTNPVVSSMAVIPDPTASFDQVWMVVQRWINGAQVNCIEYMTKIFDDSILQEDAFQGDCGGTYYNPLTITAISTASTAVVTSAAHGLSNGQMVKIVNVKGLNQSTTVNGVTTVANLVNEKTFTVEGVTTNTFQLYSNGTPVSSVGWTGYVSGGQCAQLITSISGVTWLEGETVGILADGGIHPDVVVSSGGVITLNYPAAKVQFGYRFNSQAQMLRVEGGAADGTSFGKTRRVVKAAFQLHRTGDMSIGINFNDLFPLVFTQADVNQADVATPLFSGMIRENIDAAYDFENQLCWQESSMLPGCVQSVTAFMEEQDI